MKGGNAVKTMAGMGSIERQLREMGARLGFAPLQKGELEQEVLLYVRQSYPDAQITDLPRSIGGLLYAMRQSGCHKQCPGRARCQYHGYITEVVVHQNRYGITLGTAARSCQESIQYQTQADIDRVFKNSRIPPKLESCTFENYMVGDLERPLQAAKSVMQEIPTTQKSAILGGPNGCGKTHLAAAALKKSLEMGRAGVFILVPELLQQIRDNLENGGACDIERIAKDVDILVLDDFGSERTTDWVGERLFMLIDHRYTHRKQTIITTNAENADQLDMMIGDYGKRITSRLYEMVEEKKRLWLTGCKDFRRTKAKQQNLIAV